MYNVLIIGAGNIGAFFDNPSSKSILTHAHAITDNPHFNLLGFYDVDQERAKKAAKLWSCEAFDDFDLAMQRADVVCIAVPDQYHYDMLKLVTNYPVKFVFAEKPITATISQAYEIQELYSKLNIPVNVNYSRRFLNEIALIKSKMNSFGKFISGNGYYGKGILHNGSHMMDLMINLLGEIKDYQSFNKIYDCFDDDPSAEVSLKIAGGKVNLIPVDCRKVTIFELELLFEKARIRMINGCQQIEIYEVQRSKIYHDYYYYEKIKELNVDYGKAFTNAYNNIFNVIEKKEKALSPIESATKVLEICCNLQN